MSTEFNYAKAHRERVYPEWEKLPDGIKALYRRVQEECADQHQNRSLGMDWPADGALKAAFDAIDAQELAHAQAVVYALGCWDAKENHDLGFPRDEHGGYWKFQLFARQSLVDRGWREPWSRVDIDIKPFMEHKEGTSYDDDELSAIISERVRPVFSNAEVRCVNFRLSCTPRKGDNSKHPFCIGAKHFTYLDPRSAPCYICGCKYDDHIHDRVIILTRVPGGDEHQLSAAEQQRCVELKPLMEAHKLDGFVFAA